MKTSHLCIAVLACLLCANTALAQLNGLTSGKRYSFTETKVMPKLNKTTERKGIMVFNAPDQLAMDYSQPDGDYTHITATSFDVKKNGKVQHFPVDNPKQRMTIFRSTLLYCLGGEVDKAAELNHATKTMTDEAKLRVCTISVDKADPKEIAAIRLEYDAKNGQLIALTITEGNGNYTVYSIR